MVTDFSIKVGPSSNWIIYHIDKSKQIYNHYVGVLFLFMSVFSPGQTSSYLSLLSPKACRTTWLYHLPNFIRFLGLLQRCYSIGKLSYLFDSFSICSSYPEHRKTLLMIRGLFPFVTRAICLTCIWIIVRTSRTTIF